MRISAQNLYQEKQFSKYRALDQLKIVPWVDGVPSVSHSRVAHTIQSALSAGRLWWSCCNTELSLPSASHLYRRFWICFSLLLGTGTFVWKNARLNAFDLSIFYLFIYFYFYFFPQTRKYFFLFILMICPHRLLGFILKRSCAQSLFKLLLMSSYYTKHKYCPEFLLKHRANSLLEIQKQK